MKEYPEELCRKCGWCCRVKMIARNEVFVLPDTCEHLDRETKLCRVFARRHEVNPDCADIARGIAARVFPADCPYVADIEGYRGPIEVNCEEEIWEYLERQKGSGGRHD